MRYLRSLVTRARRVRNRCFAAREALLESRLEEIDFSSGLGDCAYLLYGLVKSVKPSVVVEIGSARGRSTCYFGMALKENGTGKLYAIDPHTHTSWNDENSLDTFGILSGHIKRFGLENHVEILRSTSGEIARNWTLPIDLLFIDGDHSYQGVKHDWEMFAPFVQPFGAIIFHDTLWELRPESKYLRADMGVPRFVDGLREQGYPVITLDHDFGVSLVQPVQQGVALLPRQSQPEAVKASTH